MKICRLVILVIISIIGCQDQLKDQTYSPQPTIHTNYREHSNYSFLVREFKLNFFLKCLGEGYNNSEEIKQIFEQDISLMGDFPMGLAGYKLIDSLALVAKHQIYTDSIKIHDRFDYSAGKKRAFSICLQLYESEWLDSIATTWNKK